MIDSKASKVSVKLVRSFHGRLKSHIATVKGLGLRKMHHEVTLQNTKEIRGMINKISYMLEVKEA